ncbi:TPA: hypothetical protein CPT87_02805 [Candidatus Gastranaerophilales bacterium HUM_5]|nr:MAG TPA: hypothetical protein CPT99_00190 [Candidatus Gastranaerophilales bacterium HUM_4]DAA92171.1 MAG TPA: hypothetical protein CPT87_02805 [Candidatus Gastranaerophilales bacterium HUM_5]
MLHIMNKIKPLLLFLPLLLLLTGCGSDGSLDKYEDEVFENSKALERIFDDFSVSNPSELEDKINELKEEKENLETENQELKAKLDNIQSTAIMRNGHYGDVLDDISSEAEY